MNRLRNMKGFTLLELIIVIVIIGVLATLGLSQYSRMAEKARGGEAKQILGDLRKVAAAYRAEYGAMNAAAPAPAFNDAYAGIGGAGLIPSACSSTHFFRYSIGALGVDTVVLTATRCADRAANAAAGVIGGTVTLNVNFAGNDTWASVPAGTW